MLAAWAVSSKGVVHEQPPQVVFSIMLQPGSTNFVNLGISGADSQASRSMLNEVTNFSLTADSGEQGFIHQWPAADMLTSSTKTIVGKASRSDILSCGLANAVIPYGL